MGIIKKLIDHWEVISAFLTGAFFVCKWLYNKIIIKIIKWVAKVNAALSELQPNGGGSIKDKVNKGVDVIQAMNIKVDGIIGRQKAILNEGLTAMYTNNSEGVCTSVNKAWVKLTGLPKDLATGRGWIRIMHPDDLKRIQQEGEDFINDGNEFDSEFRIIHYITKAVINVHCTASKVLDSNGNLSSIIGTLEKI